MKVYEAVFNEDTSKGVYALSVVENPAMQDLWITLSEHPKEVNLTLANEEKRLLLGAALIPDKRIYRNVDGNEFYITFNAQTIEKLAHSFLKNGNQNNSSLEHETQLSGMSVVEAWIVQDPNNDKSNSYGKTYEKGTWVTMMKVDNEDVWQKAKNGEIKGFSIDALIGLKELQVNFKNEVNMDLKSITDAIADGFKSLKFSNETPEALAEEPQKEVEEKQPETVDAEAIKQTIKDALAKLSKDVDSILESFKAEFKKEVETKDATIENLKTELSKQPETAPLRANPEAQTDVKLTAQGKLLEKLRQTQN
jgi:hypothetical protein